MADGLLLFVVVKHVRIHETSRDRLGVDLRFNVDSYYWLPHEQRSEGCRRVLGGMLAESGRATSTRKIRSVHKRRVYFTYHFSLLSSGRIEGLLPGVTPNCR